MERFEEKTFDILILSGSASKTERENNFELLGIISSKCSTTQVLVLVHPKELSLAFSAMKAGSYQYAKLPIGDDELKLLVDTALYRRPEYCFNLLLKDKQQKATFEDMVGVSPSMQEVYRHVRQAAVTDIPVLITGDTGTGKDLVASAIHHLSKRTNKPFIPIHLGAFATGVGGR